MYNKINKCPTSRPNVDIPNPEQSGRSSCRPQCRPRYHHVYEPFLRAGVEVGESRSRKSSHTHVHTRAHANTHANIRNWRWTQRTCSQAGRGLLLYIKTDFFWHSVTLRDLDLWPGFRPQKHSDRWHGQHPAMYLVALASAYFNRTDLQGHIQGQLKVTQ